MSISPGRFYLSDASFTLLTTTSPLAGGLSIIGEREKLWCSSVAAGSSISLLTLRPGAERESSKSILKPTAGFYVLMFARLSTLVLFVCLTEYR
ncbi:hypothetical protein RRG08_061246 [Elysia crispata]|uniref:Uncharacterized protein n=1 Tax=Elysia crispata TaxID=231223 RepID=A0AAE0ZGA7_9GAST|nr:hypothetical protein RRG08_061246 [Elysia crispata]